jgi:hypothetical protein
VSGKCKVAALSFTVTLALAGVVVLLWLLGGPSVAHADPGTLYVAPDGDDSNTCGSEANRCATIQRAVDVASSGDVIKVATGVYTDVQGRPDPGYTNPPASGIITQVVYISKTVTIRGGYTTTNWTTPYPITQPTTLDAQGQGRGLLVAGYISPTIEGLRITGGDATGLGGGGWSDDDVGGGVYVSSYMATISNNWVFSNTAQRGSGLFLLYSDVTLSGNTIFANSASLIGGGVYGVLAGTISNNRVFGNTAYRGGGLYLYVSIATLSGNTVFSNTAEYGGGLYLYQSIVTLNGNTVISNTAVFGGGLYLDTYATLTNTVVADNQADTAGSGLYIKGGSHRLLHTTIARNSGGDGSGIYVTGGSVYRTVALTNTILVSHTVGISVTGGNTVTVNSILWHGTPITVSQATIATVTVQNQQQGDPRFAADGYHLIAGSAAVDEGVDAGVTTDIDGDSRPQASAPDLGADEFVPESAPDGDIYLPIIMKNASPWL